MITKPRHWALPLALIGGMAVGAALTLSKRRDHRLAKKQQHNEDLQSWEDEGGNVVAPAAAPRQP